MTMIDGHAEHADVRAHINCFCLPITSLLRSSVYKLYIFFPGSFPVYASLLDVCLRSQPIYILVAHTVKTFTRRPPLVLNYTAPTLVYRLARSAREIL